MLTIVMLAHNNIMYTASALRDLAHLDRSKYEVILVDNGSSDLTHTLEKQFDINYIRLESNLGFGKACNIGYRKAKYDNIMFLNNDIKVRDKFDSWPEPIIEQCHNGLVGPTMGQLDRNLHFIKEANENLDGLSYMSGWCLSASKKHVFSKLECRKDHIFNEFQYFCYFEDVDLSFTARRKKVPLIVVDVPVIHYGRKTTALLNTGKLYTEAQKVFNNNWSYLKHTGTI